MDMSASAAKRRRFNEANHTLSKPFRSPFKTSPVKDTNPASRDGITLSSTSSKANTATPLAPRSTNALLTPKNPLTTPGPRTKKTFTSPQATIALNSDPEIVPLLRTQRDLEKELRIVREQLDTAQQAQKIEAESHKADPNAEIDAELIELTDKWKAASQTAAEELFSKVQDRVNRMGGPRAWKEAQKRQEEWQNSWNQEDAAAGADKGDDDDDEDEEERKQGPDREKRDLYAEYDIDPETENEKSQRAKGVGDTGELPGQEDEFTMAMMLRTLNVDLDIIGYDRHQQRWVE